MKKPPVIVWLQASVDSICRLTGGESRLILQIQRLYGTTSRVEQLLKGKLAQFEARTFKPASEIIVHEHEQEKDRWGVKLGPTTGHQLVEEMAIGVKAEWDEDTFTTDTLGLSIVGWGLLKNFDAMRAQVEAKNQQAIKDRRQRIRDAEALKEKTFKLYKRGARIGIDKPITSQTLITLARFFEHRAWPEGLMWATVVGGMLKEVPAPEMIPAPKLITVAVPEELHNPQMDLLKETIMDKPVTQTEGESARPRPQQVPSAQRKYPEYVPRESQPEPEPVVDPRLEAAFEEAARAAKNQPVVLPETQPASSESGKVKPHNRYQLKGKPSRRRTVGRLNGASSAA